MEIFIERIEDLYRAVVTGLGAAENVLDTGPMTEIQLVATLRAAGCHTADIGAALWVADPDWADRHAPGGSFE